MSLSQKHGFRVSRRIAPSYFLSLVSCISFLASLTSPAIVDSNENGVSDLWERNFNSGELFPGTFDPAADPDGDGWTHAQEAAVGTDPMDANPPNGIVRPEISQIPAVYTSPEEPEGEPVIVTPETIRITWPTLAGKRYSLRCSPDLSTGSWIPMGDPRVGNGGEMGKCIPLTQPDGSTPAALFWRVAVEDFDTDGDGFDDYEEHLLGTDPLIADRDADGLPDAWETSFAASLLALGHSPESWGANYGDLTSGNLNPSTDYTGEGITAGQLGTLAVLPLSSQPADGIHWINQGKRNVLAWGFHKPAEGNQLEQSDGLYFNTNEGWYGPAYEITTRSQLTPEYLAAQVLLNPWGDIPGGGFSRFGEVSHTNYTRFSGEIWVGRSRMVRLHPATTAITRDFLMTTSRGSNYIWNGQVIAAESKRVHIAAGKLISEWVEFTPPIEKNSEHRMYLLPVDLDIKYASQAGTKELEESKEDTGDGGYISLKSQTHQGEDITPTTYLVIRPTTGLPNDSKVRLKFNSGGRYKVARDRLGDDPIVSEITEFPAGQETRLYLVGETKSQSRGGENITMQIEVGGSWVDGDSLKATVVQTQFQIDLRVFIPYNWVNIPLHPSVAGGDNRSYDPNLNGTYRVSQNAILNLYREWVPDVENRMIDDGKSAGITYHYSTSDVTNFNSSAKHSEDTTVKPSYINSGASPSNSGIADLSGVQVTVLSSLSNDNRVTVEFEGEAAEPILPVAAPINWRFSVGISKANPLNPSFSLEGAHDGFPAYEIYVNCKHLKFPHTEVVTWKPPLSADVWELVGDLDVFVGPLTGTINQ